MKHHGLTLTAIVGMLLAAPASASPAAPITRGPTDGKQVALTFDADFTPAWIGNGKRYVNDELLSLLRSQEVNATLFITGLWAEQYPTEMRTLTSEAMFEIANHTWKHFSMRTSCYKMHTIANDEDRDAVLRADQIIARFAPNRSRLFRFPGGCYDAQSLANVERLGFTPVQWDVISGDAFERDPNVIIHDVLTGVRPGSIVVAHMHGADRAPATTEAFKVIIPELRRRGYTFVTVSQLLHPVISRRAVPVSKPLASSVPKPLAHSASAPIPAGSGRRWPLVAVVALLVSVGSGLKRRTRNTEFT